MIAQACHSCVADDSFHLWMTSGALARNIQGSHAVRDFVEQLLYAHLCN
jgi:hypothetical protein